MYVYLSSRIFSLLFLLLLFCLIGSTKKRVDHNRTPSATERWWCEAPGVGRRRGKGREGQLEDADELPEERQARIAPPVRDLRVSSDVPESAQLFQESVSTAT